jgi:hypothetical protein
VLAFLRVGAYATEPTQANWDRDVRAAVTHYHLDPERLRAHLRGLRETGERKVAVVLWFTEPIDGHDTWAHAVVPRADGSLPPQARANLMAFLADIDALGFDEVQVRFGPQGGAANPAAPTRAAPPPRFGLVGAFALLWRLAGGWRQHAHHEAALSMGLEQAFEVGVTSHVVDIDGPGNQPHRLERHRALEPLDPGRTALADEQRGAVTE